ncbi:MAG: winged helix-turn-helix domain-containing tetratricopeptide repeat protein [Hyphomonadaceae bacterium]
MIYRFGDFELDAAKAELRKKGAAVAVEPQVFALLKFLIENRERLVSRDDIVAAIWNGRIVSDAAISSRIKSARRALDDDGQTQWAIRTLHGAGFRFVAEIKAPPISAAVSAPAEQQHIAQPHAAPAARPSIAVLPFRLIGVAGEYAAIADALPQDLITGLSRLRWLFVIARATSFQFRGAEAEPARVGAVLNVRYCLGGAVEVFGKSLAVSIELSDAEASGVLWSERFQTTLEGVHEIRERIIREVAAALELRIPINEIQRARLKAPESLDAWSAYHLGIHHMFRFTKEDNESASRLFSRAAALEPSFARAHAGLSFTHFQTAFLRYERDHARHADLAQHHAERSLSLDPIDPFGNLTMGRAFWLRGDLPASLPWLGRANELNPNYAHARYSAAWTEALLGAAETSLAHADEAIALSPLDPLLYGMLGVRAFSFLAAQDYAAAAEAADRAAQSPGAHALIEMIAAAAHHIAGGQARAATWAASAKARAPQLDSAAFFHAFPFHADGTRRQLAAALAAHGF